MGTERKFEEKSRAAAQEEARGNPLGYAPIRKLLIKFAVPAVVSMLINALYNIVDQIFIGNGVGYLGNAATTVAFPAVTIILAAATLLGAGGSAYAAIKLGEKDERQAEKTLGNIFVLLVIMGVLITVLGLVFLEPLLQIFGATEKNIGYSRQYLSIILLGAPFNMIGIGLSNLARTDGNPSMSMYSILIGAVLNTILDPIYIFVFHWGVTGAAIATITSQIISAAILIYYFAKKGNMRFKKENFQLSGRLCFSAVSLGISSGITQIAATILQIVLNQSLTHYGNLSEVTGDVALSAMGIVSKISMILISICIGIGIGSQPILGFNKGADKPERIRETYIKAVLAATLISIVGWGACQAIPHLILSLFGGEEGQFMKFAVRCLRIYMLGIFTAGFQIVSTSYFQATGQPLKASVLSMLRQLILLIPLVLILPRFYGLDGILYAGPAADITSALIVSGFLVFEMKRLSGWIKNKKGTAYGV